MSLGGPFKFTPLMEAALYGRTRVLARLLSHLLTTREEEMGEEEEDERRQRIDAVLNARGLRGGTALYRACRNDATREEARLLLQAGASPFVRDNEGLLPIEKVRMDHLTTYMVPLLEAYMEEPERLWLLAKGRQVGDARHAVAGGRCGENVEALAAAVPPCFRGRVGAGKEGLNEILEALPCLQYAEAEEGGTTQAAEEDEASLDGQGLYAAKVRAVVACVVEGDLVPELWHELKEYMCVRFDERAWGTPPREVKEATVGLGLGEEGV